MSPAFYYSQIKLELTVCLSTYKHAWRRSQVCDLLRMWRTKRSLCCLNDICWILALQACLQAVVAFCMLLAAYFILAYSDRVSPGCLSLHLILRLLQLKHPRRDFVCPFLGMGLRGKGVVLSGRQPSDSVGESLDELSLIL